MRVLLVNAYPAGNARGAERFGVFRQHAQRVIKELEKCEVTDVELVERTRSDLDEFLFEMHSEFASPSCITNFDRLDFVLVDGDTNALPWAPAMRKLALLTKMCMMTGKCVFASGVGAGLLAYVCSTGGEHFRVMNNGGKGSLIDDVRAIPSPPQSPAASTLHSAQDVLLDTKSGDFFAFGARERCWIPKGNTGLVMHSSDHARDYGAKVNSARAGTKPAQLREHLGHQLCLSKRGETKCCIRLEHANHVLFTSIPRREFVANCRSKWDLDEEIASTGTNHYRVLLDSSRGPMLVEFGNCVGSHFLLSPEYPESGKLLRNFVLAKFEDLKVHAHIDRSYVSAISGSSRLKDRLNQAQTKSVLHSTRASLSLSSQLSSGEDARVSSFSATSSSAAPRKTNEDVAEGLSSKLAFASPESSDNNAGFAGGALQQCQHGRLVGSDAVFGADGPEVETSGGAAGGNQNPAPRRRRVRVPQKNELEKPYCAIRKFDKMRGAEKQAYYSVVNDAPYVGPAEREAVELQKNKLKWTAGPFRTAVGKATTHTVPVETSVFAAAPFVQKNTPFYIIQRRELELKETHKPTTPASASSHSRQPPQRPKTAGFTR